MKKRFFSVCFLSLISFFSFANTLAAAENNDALIQKLILQYINEYRIKRHLQPLTLNTDISREAQKHSQAMANQSVPFGHTHFNDRIKRVYQAVGNGQGGAENVAYYKMDAKRLVEGWLASSGHRRNIEGHYNITGIGIAHGKPGWGYFTQIFVLSEPKTAARHKVQYRRFAGNEFRVRSNFHLW